MGKRQPNESQRWYCEQCGRPTVHKVSANAIYNDTDLYRLKLTARQNGFERGRGYRRTHDCTVCEKGYMQTIEIHGRDFVELIEERDKLRKEVQEAKKLLKELDRLRQFRKEVEGALTRSSEIKKEKEKT